MRKTLSILWFVAFVCAAFVSITSCGAGTAASGPSSNSTAGSSAITITANPATIAPGGSSTLTVTATNATQVVITESPGTASYTLAATGGTQSVMPSATTTYTATATMQSGGTATAQTTVTVTPTGVAGPIITTPANGASVTSPVAFGGSAGTLQNVDHLQVLLDGKTSIFYGSLVASESKWMFVPDGQHTLTLSAYTSSGTVLGSTMVSINVTSQVSPAVLSGLQNLPGWQSCTLALLGSPCAGGIGDAVTTQVQDQSSPSLSGSSALYTLSGTQGYSNALWYLALGGGTLLSHFTYDLDFYIDNGDAPETLEFDLNQSFGGVRFTWGTECSYKNTKKWDVWNPAAEVWIVTSAPCPPVASNQWHHLTWQFEQVSNQVRYLSITLDGTTYPINITVNPQPNWDKQGISIAFQMDGDYQQTPYNVWLDNVTLTASY